MDKKRVNEFGFAGEQPAEAEGAPASNDGSAADTAETATTRLLEGEPQPTTSELPAGEGSESSAKVGVSEEGLTRRKRGGEKAAKESGGKGEATGKSE